MSNLSNNQVLLVKWTLGDMGKMDFYTGEFLSKVEGNRCNPPLGSLFDSPKMVSFHFRLCISRGCRKVLFGRFYLDFHSKRFDVHSGTVHQVSVETFIEGDFSRDRQTAGYL